MAMFHEFTGDTLEDAIEKAVASSQAPISFNQLMLRQIQVLEAVKQDPSLIQDVEWQELANDWLCTDVYSIHAHTDSKPINQRNIINTRISADFQKLLSETIGASVGDIRDGPFQSDDYCSIRSKWTGLKPWREEGGVIQLDIRVIDPGPYRVIGTGEEGLSYLAQAGTNLVGIDLVYELAHNMPELKKYSGDDTDPVGIAISAYEDLDNGDESPVAETLEEEMDQEAVRQEEASDPSLRMHDHNGDYDANQGGAEKQDYDKSLHVNDQIELPPTDYNADDVVDPLATTANYDGNTAEALGVDNDDDNDDWAEAAGDDGNLDWSDPLADTGGYDDTIKPVSGLEDDSKDAEFDPSKTIEFNPPRGEDPPYDPTKGAKVSPINPNSLEAKLLVLDRIRKRPASVKLVIGDQIYDVTYGGEKRTARRTKGIWSTGLTLFGGVADEKYAPPRLEVDRIVVGRNPVKNGPGLSYEPSERISHEKLTEAFRGGQTGRGKSVYRHGRLQSGDAAIVGKGKNPTWEDLDGIRAIREVIPLSDHDLAAFLNGFYGDGFGPIISGDEEIKRKLEDELAKPPLEHRGSGNRAYFVRPAGYNGLVEIYAIDGRLHEIERDLEGRITGKKDLGSMLLGGVPPSERTVTLEKLYKGRFRGDRMKGKEGAEALIESEIKANVTPDNIADAFETGDKFDAEPLEHHYLLGTKDLTPKSRWGRLLERMNTWGSLPEDKWIGKIGRQGANLYGIIAAVGEVPKHITDYYSEQQKAHEKRLDQDREKAEASKLRKGVKDEIAEMGEDAAKLRDEFNETHRKVKRPFYSGTLREKISVGMAVMITAGAIAGGAMYKFGVPSWIKDKMSYTRISGRPIADLLFGDPIKAKRGRKGRDIETRLKDACRTTAEEAKERGLEKHTSYHKTENLHYRVLCEGEDVTAVEIFCENEDLKARRWYKDGLKHGPSVEWNCSSGDVLEQSQYRRGERVIDGRQAFSIVYGLMSNADQHCKQNGEEGGKTSKTLVDVMGVSNSNVKYICDGKRIITIAGSCADDSKHGYKFDITFNSQGVAEGTKKIYDCAGEEVLQKVE